MLFASPLTPLEDVMRHVLDWLHTHVGLPWAWAIVALTVIVRMLLVPLTVKQIHSMQNLQRYAPQMKEIQKKYKGDSQKQNEELMKFYRENKINPAASCLPMRRAVPGLHRALLRAAELLEPPAGRRGPVVARPRPEHHRPRDVALGRLLLLVVYVDQPDGVDVLHVDDDGQDAADAS